MDMSTASRTTQKTRSQSFVTAGLDAALEALKNPAFIVTGKGRVLRANVEGRRLLSRSSATVEAELSRSKRKTGQTPPRFSFIRLMVRRPHYLAVLDLPATVEERVLVAARIWGLTARQAEVLGCLTEGLPNKLIASRLGCALGTVELHVTAILKKTEVLCRGELVAKFWGSLV
jgi:DNA-binding NarL/FixJ family response regulator